MKQSTAPGNPFRRRASDCAESIGAQHDDRLVGDSMVEFLLAGATAVQIGTASYADPRAVQRIADSLEKWCARHHIAKVKDLIGAVQVNE